MSGAHRRGAPLAAGGAGAWPGGWGFRAGGRGGAELRAVPWRSGRGGAVARAGCVADERRAGERTRVSESPSVSRHSCPLPPPRPLPVAPPAGAPRTGEDGSGGRWIPFPLCAPGPRCRLSDPAWSRQLGGGSYRRLGLFGRLGGRASLLSRTFWSGWAAEALPLPAPRVSAGVAGERGQAGGWLGAVLLPLSVCPHPFALACTCVVAG